MTKNETAELQRRWEEYGQASHDRMNAEQYELDARKHWHAYLVEMMDKYASEAGGGLHHHEYIRPPLRAEQFGRARARKCGDD